MVTGAGRGIGRAVALRLASQGASIVAVSRTAADIESLCLDIESRGGRAEAVVADVAGAACLDSLGGYAPDILINNAGATLRKSLDDITLAEWRATIDVNLTSAFLLCRAFIPAMIARGKGRIVNMSSVTAHTPAPARAAYAAAKAGVLGFTRALALELAPHGITVNSISPGTFPTVMNEPILADAAIRERFLSRIPLGRLGTLDEIAALVEYVCSDAATFLTGADIRIDGGWSTQ